MSDTSNLNNPSNPSNPYTVVLYHGPNCPDGFASAVVAHIALGDERDSVLYQAVNYGQPIPPVTYTAMVVYVLDFSYPRTELDNLATEINRRYGTLSRLIVLDHHKTAQAELAGCPYATFDMDKSGCVLTWEHFFPDQELPRFFMYIQDRDLWKWELPMSREFSASLSIIPRDFDAWEMCFWNFTHREKLTDEFFRNGRAILAYQQQLVEKLTAQPLFLSLGGVDGVPTVNTPVLQSEVGERLCEVYPEAKFSATWYAPDGEKELWSLRSRGEFDVSKIASQYGGGGHRNAAGFTAKFTFGFGLCSPISRQSPMDILGMSKEMNYE